MSTEKLDNFFDIILDDNSWEKRKPKLKQTRYWQGDHVVIMEGELCLLCDEGYDPLSPYVQGGLCEKCTGEWYDSSSRWAQHRKNEKKRKEAIKKKMAALEEGNPPKDKPLWSNKSGLDI